MTPGWVEFEDINRKRPVAIHLATGLVVRPDLDRPGEVTILTWQRWRDGVAVGMAFGEVMAEIERATVRESGETDHVGR